MAVVTYLVRVLPLTLIRREIKNRTIRSFLFYMPYVTLAVMTFPAILSATGTPVSALWGLCWRRDWPCAVVRCLRWPARLVRRCFSPR